MEIDEIGKMKQYNKTLNTGFNLDKNMTKYDCRLPTNSFWKFKKIDKKFRYSDWVGLLISMELGKKLWDF